MIPNSSGQLPELILYKTMGGMCKANGYDCNPGVFWCVYIDIMCMFPNIRIRVVSIHHTDSGLVLKLSSAAIGATNFAHYQYIWWSSL